MIRVWLPVSVVLLGAGLLLAGCGDGTSGGHSHGAGGHSHGADEHSHATEGHAHDSRRSVTAWSEAVEVFAERPVMVAEEKSAPWAIHVTRLDEHRPLTDGALTLRFRRPDGAAYVHALDAPAEPGLFRAQPTIPEARTFRLVAIVETPEVRDTVDLGALTVHERADAAGASGGTDAEISYSKEQQWETDFGVARAYVDSLRSSVEAPGTVVPAPGRHAEVAAPVSGLTPARPNEEMPVPGERVRAGERLAVLSPSGDASSYAETKARADRLKREVERAERLYEAEAIPKKQLIEARQELAVARAALQSMGGDEDSGFDYTLRAPIDGHVQERHLVPGRRVEAGTILYTITDPSRVWVRLHAPAEHADRLGAVRGGTFTVDGGDRLYRADRVASVGTAIDEDTRTLPVRLAAGNPNGTLTIGQRAHARLFVGAPQSGVAIPTAAIQTEDGRPVAYVQTGGESFERRPLRLGPTDGPTTLVETGVQPGEHVVTTGAYQVYLASLNTAQVGSHGHPH
jgi:RND family efflux transporter MFP subunit